MPGIKRTIYRFCQKCGAEIAFKHGWSIWSKPCAKCTKDLDGPKEPTRQIRADDVQWNESYPFPVKAFHVWCVDGWSCLVFAASASKAKAAFWKVWRSDLEWIDHRHGWDQLRCKRDKRFDGQRDIPCVIEGPSDGFQEFWAQWDDNGEWIDEREVANG